MSFRVNGAALPVFRGPLIREWNKRSKMAEVLERLISIGIAMADPTTIHKITSPKELGVPIVYKASASCIQKTGQREVATLQIKFTPTQDRKIVGFTTYRQFSLEDSFSNGQKAIGCDTLAKAINEFEGRRTLLLNAPDYVTQLASSYDLILSKSMTIASALGIPYYLLPNISKTKPLELFVNYIPRGLTGINKDSARAVIEKTSNLSPDKIKALTDEELPERTPLTLVYLPTGKDTMSSINSALLSGTKGDFHPNFLFPFPPQK